MIVARFRGNAGFAKPAKGFANGHRCRFAKRQRCAINWAMKPRDIWGGWPWYGAVTLALGLLLALIGPFGTFADLNLVQRLVYWVGIFIANGLQVLGALLLVLWRFGQRWPPVAIGATAGLLASIPATGQVHLLELWMRPWQGRDLLTTFGNVLLLTEAITITIVMVRSHMVRLKAPVKVEIGAPPAERGDALMKRIKPEARGELLALEMEDHYLRVHTNNGNDLILHRLSDALDEVAGLDGLQVHRSYWVARAAVQAVERDGRRLALVLKNGLKVPVSRNNVAALKSAGWV